MDLFNNIINIPVIQILGVLILIAIAERIGIPIVTLIKKLLKINGNGTTTDMTNRIGELEQHFNHETTDSLNRIEENLTRNFTIMFEKLDKLNEGITYLKAKKDD